MSRVFVSVCSTVVLSASFSRHVGESCNESHVVGVAQWNEFTGRRNFVLYFRHSAEAAIATRRQASVIQLLTL